MKGVGDVFTVSGQAGLKYQSGLVITINAKAAIFSGRATTELQLGGWQIEFGVTGDVGAVGDGANGKKMRGVYGRSKQVINATKSARKKAMYTAKITAIKKKVVTSSGRTDLAGLVSNVGNLFRKLFSRSKV